MATDRLTEIRDEIIALNKAQNQTSGFLNGLLMTQEAERKDRLRNQGRQREEALESKRRQTSASKTSTKGMGLGEAFGRGILGDATFGALDKMIAGAFGVAGGMLPALIKGVGRTARFGLIAAAVNSFTDDALGYIFDNFTFDDALSKEDKEKLKDDIQKGANATIGAKFLGLSWKKSLGIGLGVAASDMITDVLAKKFATDESGQFIELPDFLDPLLPKDFKIDLGDPVTRDIIGGAVGLVAISIVRFAATRFAALGLGGLALAFGAAGFPALADMMKKGMKNTAPELKLFDQKGGTPKYDYRPPPKPIAPIGDLEFQKRLKTGNLLPEDLAKLSPDQLKEMGYERVGKGSYRPYTGDNKFSQIMKNADVLADINKSLQPTLLGNLLKTGKTAGKFALKGAPFAALGYDAYLGINDPFYREKLQYGPTRAAAAGIGAGTTGFFDIAGNALQSGTTGIEYLGGALYSAITGKDNVMPKPQNPLTMNQPLTEAYKDMLESLSTVGTIYQTDEQFREHIKQSIDKFVDNGMIIKGVIPDETGALRISAQSYGALYGYSAGAGSNVIVDAPTNQTNVVNAPQISVFDGDARPYDKLFLESWYMKSGERRQIGPNSMW